MKKLTLILISLMLLTGCQSIDEMKRQERDKEKLSMTTYIEQVMDQPSNAAKILRRSLNKLESDRINVIGYDTDNFINDLGVPTVPFIAQVELVGNKEDEIILENLKEVIGEGLLNFIDEVKAHEEAYYMSEKVIGDYGVACQKRGDEKIEIYILPSQHTYLDEAKRNQIQAFCGEQLVVTAVTAGEEKSMVELSFPSYQVRYRSPELTNTTAYYQVFSDQANEIEKIRLVINQYEDGYKEGKLEEDKLLPLRRMLQEMQVGNEGEMKLIQAIEKVVDGENDQQKGKIDQLKYTIRRNDSYAYYEDLIIVEINF